MTEFYITRILRLDAHMFLVGSNRRRVDIVKAHPEIKKLMGYDPATKYKVAVSVAIQIMALHLLQGASWYTWVFFCYTLSGSINHMMTLAMHEISHNLGVRD